VTQTTRNAIEIAAHRLGALATRDEPLAPYTTYRVGGAAALFVRPRTIDDLRAVGEARRDAGVPLLVVGRGSNMLVADDGFKGIAVSLAEMASDIDLGNGVGDAPCVVSAGGAVSLPVLARRTAAAGLTGFEWGVGIPGSVGGAVQMNAGGHGSDMAAVLVDVDIISLDDDSPVVEAWPVGRLGLHFRGSQLGPLDVVLSARLSLAPGDAEAAAARVSEIVRWRREHQPGGQNCGSVFVNPVPGEVSAGELIDRLGLRGTRLGTAEVSIKHANFIQADEGGRAADVMALMDTVRQRVGDATGYQLRSEVRLIGFEDGR
jgi:UDP-N-acetylmuramate dehydrogenase